MPDSNKDKRELLKLKQGLVDENESEIKETGYDVKMPETAAEKTKNWMWYHTGAIILAVILTAVGIVVYFQFFVSKNPDVSIYSAGNYAMSIRTSFEKSMSGYAPDANNDGKRVVEIKQGVDDPMLGNVELYNQVENGTAQVFIGTKEQLTQLYDDILAADGYELFCPLDFLTGEQGYVLDLRDTLYGKKMQIFTTELYAAVRNTNDENSEHALEFISNLVNGKEYIQKEG